MVDHGISENYLIYWLEAGDDFHTRIDRGLDYGRYVARRGGADTSLNSIYERALLRFNGNIVLAAEVLRRALSELANPAPVDDSLPPADSPIWKAVASSVRYYASYSRIEPAPRYRPQPARISRTPYFE